MINEYTLAVAAFLYILGWFALILLVGCFPKSPRKSRLVWCTSMKCFSLVEFESTPEDGKNHRAVGRCLLWPELYDCEQRCVR